ncbi:hypothetical protein GF327_03840 [Candidatus Woesearchaeota archaeon]|nr:hypothetical protein [Candidatus Woesearchaeota archaeon]
MEEPYKKYFKLNIKKQESEIQPGKKEFETIKTMKAADFYDNIEKKHRKEINGLMKWMRE